MNDDRQTNFATAADALRAWDAGEEIISVEMGGISPGYEQCIQVTAFECVRWMLVNPPVSGWENLDNNNDAWRAYVDNCEATVLYLPVIHDLGLSGAQWGAAINMATIYCRRGYANGLAMVAVERHIKVCKNTPILRLTPQEAFDAGMAAGQKDAPQ